MNLINIIFLVFAILSVIPFFFDLNKYLRELSIKFSKDSLLIIDGTATYNVESIEKICICTTVKYRILKNDPILILPFTNRFGKIEDISFTVDNIQISPVIEIDGEHTICKHKITNKSKGEFIYVEAVSVMNSDSNLIDRRNDGLAFWFDFYKCKFLKILIVFPVNFNPYNLSFTIRPTDFSISKKIKEVFHVSKTPFLFSKNRKAVEWPIPYPKFNKAYRIGWSWLPN